jgi:hypothetical protein
MGFLLGGLLLAYFFVPVGREHAFLWEKLLQGQVSDIGFMRWIYPAGMGLLLVLLGLLPLPTGVRGALYATLALPPVAFVAVKAPEVLERLRTADLESVLGASAASGVGLSSDEILWRTGVLGGALLLLPFALFLRARKWDSIVARLLVAIGVAGVLAAYLWPFDRLSLAGGDRLPVVGLFTGTGRSGPLGYAVAGYLALPLLFALFSAAAFAGKHTAGMGSALGTLFLLWLPVALIAYIVYGAVRGAHPAALIEVGRLLVYGFACQIFVVYGLVHLFPMRRAGWGIQA